MPKKFGPEVELTVQTLSKEGYSQRMIVDVLKRDGISIGQRSVSNIINSIGKQRKAMAENRQMSPIKQTRLVRTRKIIAKVKRMIDKENPESYRTIAKKRKIGLDTVHKIIHVDLNKVTRMKTRVHRLTDAHIQNRKKNCRKLYEN